jgi:hypothetical protein
VPDFNVWWASTGGSTPKLKMVGQPDTRVVMDCREGAKYRVFLGSDYSDTTGTCISGDPSVGDVYDTGNLTLTNGTFKINVGLVNLSVQLTQGEVVTVVYYDNSNNIISIRPMRTVLRGASINTYSTTITGYSILSKFNSSTDYNFLDCRFTSIINREDFAIRKHYANGTYEDLPWNTTECSIVGLDSFLSGDSGHKMELMLIDKSIGFNMLYHIEKGGSGLVEVPTGIDPFDWDINLYDLSNFNTIYNGNERPQAVNRSVVIYPKGGWEVNARPTTLVFEGVYNGSNAGGTLGTVTVFDKAGNKISYNNARTYEYGEVNTPNRFKSTVNLYYVGDNDIGGAIVLHADTAMAINKIARVGAFNRNVVQFGLQAIGSLLNYAFDVPNGAAEIPLALAHKRTVNNELPIAEGTAFNTQGGYPWLYGYSNKPIVSNIRYGEFLIPTYGDTAILDQGIEFLGRDIDLSDNQYIIEAVFCLRSDYTFDPELARGVLENSSNPQNVLLQDSQVVVPVRPYVIPPPVDTGPVSPNPALIPEYVFDPSNNRLFELPVPQSAFDNNLVPPDYKLYGMIFPNTANPSENPDTNVHMLAGNPPYYGGYVPEAISQKPIIGQINGTSIHFAYRGNDCLVLNLETIPQGQPHFFSFWTTAPNFSSFIFQTGQRFTAQNEAPGYIAGKTPKYLFDGNAARSSGIHCSLQGELQPDSYNYIANNRVLQYGTGFGQGPYYDSYANIPDSADDKFFHLVVYITGGGEMVVWCNKIAGAPAPMDYSNNAHNLILFGDFQPMQLSNVQPIYRSIGVGPLEVYLGVPDQAFVDYLYAKTPYTGFSERMYVDDIFNVINKNQSVPYFLKAQGEKVLDSSDIIYKSSLLTTKVDNFRYVQSNGDVRYYDAFLFSNFDNTDIPYLRPRLSFTNYTPWFKLENNLGVDDIICISTIIDPLGLTEIGTFFHDGQIYPEYVDSPVMIDSMSSGIPIVMVNIQYGNLLEDPAQLQIIARTFTSLGDPYWETWQYNDNVLASGSFLLPNPNAISQVATVVIVVDKVAGTLRVNFNITGDPITDNITFDGGLTLVAPFNGSNYNHFVLGGLKGYENLDGATDLTISKKRIGVDEYNQWVKYAIDHTWAPFRGGIIEYDMTKRAYIEDVNSMYVTLESGSIGGAVMRYRNNDPLSAINGIMVTTKTDPNSGTGATALDKLSLLPANDITEIEWRIKIYSLSSLSTAAEAGVFLLEKHTDENYSDGYTLQWGGGFYNLTFNAPSNITDTGLTLTSPTSNVFDIWHTGRYVINGNNIKFYLNGTLVSDETFPPEEARRFHTLGPLRIGTSVTNSDGAVLDVPTGGQGFASTDFDLDYLRIKQNGTYTFNLYFGVQNLTFGNGGVQPPPPPLPYFSMKVGDNELRIDTVNKRAAWINAVEGLLVQPTTDLLNIINRNVEVLNTVTLVRKGARAAMFINGTRVWINDTMDYDEDVGAQPVVINWGRTTEYGPVPYLQSLMVYTGAQWIDDVLISTGSPSIAITDLLANSEYVRIDGTIINNTLKSVIGTVINFNSATGYNSLEGDILEGNYPWV